MRCFLLLAVVLSACAGDSEIKADRTRDASCFTSAAVAPIASAISNLSANSAFACIGQRREDVSSEVVDADQELLDALRAYRNGVLAWNACVWLPSQHGQEPRGSYPVAGEPHQPAAAFVVGGFRCSATTADVDIRVVSSINDIVVESGSLRTFGSDDAGGWSLLECSTTWTT